MIIKNISKYLIWTNNINNTKLTKSRKNFHKTIIRKFTISIIRNWSTFNRINSIITSTNSYTFIYLWFPNPFKRYISKFRSKSISIINNILSNKTIYLSCDNTFLNHSSPSNKPNINKITIKFSHSNWITLKKFSFFLRKFITNINKIISISIPSKKTTIVTTITIFSII